MKTHPHVLVLGAVALLTIASASARAAEGDPIPGADIYIEQEPQGEPIKAGDCNKKGGQVLKRTTGKWYCKMPAAKK